MGRGTQWYSITEIDDNERAEWHVAIVCPVNGVGQSITVKIFILFDIAVARNHDILRAVQLMPFRYMGYDYDNRFSRCH